MSRRRRLTGVFARMTTFEALRSAALRAARGVRRGRGAAAWLAELEGSTLALQRDLHAGTWSAGPLRTFRIRDPKPRTIAVAPFPDRVVHHALCQELAPMFDRFADPHSYACRPGGGPWRAAEQVQRLARRHPWCLRLDIAHYFETVRHDVLVDALARGVADPRALDVACTLLAAGVGPPGVGLPIGNLTSQHFGNHLLGCVDHYAREQLRVGGWVRYMDDMVAFLPDKARCWEVHDALDAFLRERLQLRLKHAATQVHPAHIGIAWLGMRVWPGQVRLDGARIRRLGRRLRRTTTDPVQTCAEREHRLAASQAVLAWAERCSTTRWRRAWVLAHPAALG